MELAVSRKAVAVDTQHSHDCRNARSIIWNEKIPIIFFLHINSIEFKAMKKETMK